MTDPEVGDFDDFESPPADLGYLTPPEMAMVEADRARGLTDAMSDESNHRLTPVNVRPATAPAVQVWLNDPARYLHVLRRMPYDKFTYDSAYSVRHARRQGTFAQLEAALPEGYNFELLLIGPDRALLFERNAPRVGDKVVPTETLPVWKYGDDPEELIRMCRAYPRRKWSRIVIGFLPTKMRVEKQGLFLTKYHEERVRLLNWLHKVQLAFPDVVLHLHKGKVFRHMFGLSLTAADFDPYSRSVGGYIILPNGEVTHVNRMRGALRWLHVLGYSRADLAGDDDRVMFNIASALWAAENFCSRESLAHTRYGRREDPFGLHRKPVIAPTRRWGDDDLTKPTRPTVKHMAMRPLEITPEYQPMYAGHPEPFEVVEPIADLPLIPIRARRRETLDKVLCNSCSLAPRCEYVREGGLCILKSADTTALVRLFGTRDAELVAQGLGDVLAIQAQRHGKLAQAWDQSIEEIKASPASQVIAKSKHLTELESSLVRGAEALIKVLSPETKINSNVPAVNATQINVYNPATLVADVVRRLEEKGIERSAIEPSMIMEAAQDQGLVPIDDIPEAGL